MTCLPALARWGGVPRHHVSQRTPHGLAIVVSAYSHRLHHGAKTCLDYAAQEQRKCNSALERIMKICAPPASKEIANDSMGIVLTSLAFHVPNVWQTAHWYREVFGFSADSSPDGTTACLQVADSWLMFQGGPA